jgi:hypothetical protein
MAFDLEKDPNEMNSIADDQSLTMEEISYIANNAELYYLDNFEILEESGSVNKNTIERLKELGYVQ